jgi:nucleoside-diphosphate-sugar epimerase
MIFLITGASGFLGKILSKCVLDAGNELITLGKTGNNINVDLSQKSIDIQLPYSDIIVHAAGKAHTYPKTNLDSEDFFNVNVRGTENLLNSINKKLKPKKFILISSVSVYGLNQGENINENYPLNAKDPYGLSKILTEKLVEDWCKSNNVHFLILRLPLIAGPNPPGNLGKMVDGIRNGYYFNVDKGNARKSIVLADDIGALITNLPDVFLSGIYNLTDGYNPSFSELSSYISNELNLKKPMSLPMWLLNPLAKFGDFFSEKFPLNTNKLNKISLNLTFNDDKARNFIGWKSNHVVGTKNFSKSNN